MDIDYRECAEGHIGYFRHIASDQSQPNVWVKGLETAQEWLRLIVSEDVSQDEIAKFMGVVHANRNRSSHWMTLACDTYDWASSKGLELPPPKDFLAPDNVPWITNEEVTLKGLVQSLLSYFEQSSQEDPEYPMWSVGLEATIEWQRLLEKPTVSEKDVTHLSELLVEGKKFGSSWGWFELEFEVYRWYKFRGFVSQIPSNYNSSQLEYERFSYS